MSTEPGKEEGLGSGHSESHRANRRKVKKGAWDSICANCGRYVKGFRATRILPWQRVLPYCRNCERYALRGVHYAALAVIVPLGAAALLATLFLLLWWLRFFG